MRTITIKRSVITLAGVAALLAGCGGGDSAKPGSVGPTDNGISVLAPDEALQRATAALKGAKSYRLKGNLDVDGTRMGLDFRVSGTDLGGRLSVDDGKAELLSVAGQKYVQADKKFWVKAAGPDAGNNMVKLVGDKWAKVPEKNKDFADVFSAANIDKLLKPGGTLTKGETKDIEGVKTIGLVDKSANGGTLYVATTGQPYPIRVEGTDTAKDQIIFSDFGATFDDLKAPPAAEVVDLEKLMRK